MADPPHRTSPPHPGPWTFNLQRDQTDTWLSSFWPISITNKFSATLKNALTKPNVIRLLRSDLSEWSEDDGWHCYRLLGAGSFGTAAVWHRPDPSGKLVDEIVVKEDRRKGHSKYPDAASRANIFLDEAEIMHTLNTHSKSGNIVHLRGYKAFLRMPRINVRKNPKGLNEIHRFYLENAPYGTLNNLITRYKAFNRYLPELFLWHLFNSLARAVLALEDLPNEKLCYVHLDLKPDNIFLGYESAKNQDPDTTGGLDGEAVSYPSIKLGDFGVTEKLKKRHNFGLLGCRGVGTAYYKAPESIRVDTDEKEGPGQYGGDWDPRPNGPTDDLTSKADIWAIGKVMHDAFSLSQAGLFHVMQAKTRADYEKNGNKMIEDFHRRPFFLDELRPVMPYTKALSDMIERCMHAEASHRPTPTELYEATSRVMNERCSDAESALPFSVRNRKLYYYRNEINDMSIEERNCNLPLNVREWNDLIAPGNNDPNEPGLDIYPDQMWEMRRSRKDREEEKRWFHENRSYVEVQRFQEALFANEARVNLGQAEIEILDPDDELTYKGRQDTPFFIKEGEKPRNRPESGGSNNGDNKPHHDSDSDDDGSDNDDGNHGEAPAVNRPSQARRPSPARSQPGTNPQIPPDGNLLGGREYVLGEGASSPRRVGKYTPYVSIEAHQERFEDTRDGKGLIFVVDTAPYPASTLKDLLAPISSWSRKRAADHFDQPAEENSAPTTQLSDASSTFGGAYGAEMYRPRPLPGVGEPARKPQGNGAHGRKAPKARKRQRLADLPEVSKEMKAPQISAKWVRNVDRKLLNRKAKN